MLRTLRRFVHDQSGEDLIEYGLMVAFAAGIVSVTLIYDPLGVRPALVSAFTKVKHALQSQH